jgi:D-amino-acid dehydrogenase
VKVAIVGAGIIGLATAFQLARRGVEVVVVTDRAPGAGASTNNAGWVVPAESGPIPAPGVTLQVLRWMLRPDSPVYIKPSVRPSFVRFMLGLSRAANARSYAAGFEATARLARGTMDELDAWAADGLDFEMHEQGELRAYVDRGELRRALREVERYRQAGFEPAPLDGDQARSLEPALSDEVIGAIRFPLERHVEPGSLVRALVERLQRDGVAWVDGRVTEARALHDGGLAIGGEFGEQRADAVVIAAGAWSAAVARGFGVRLPIRPAKGYSLDYVPAPVAQRIPVMLAEAHCVLTPLAGRTRLAGTLELGGLDERVSRRRVQALRRAPLRYLRDWRPDAPSRPPTAGLRPLTPDGLPVIGRLRAEPRVVVASGHAMLGLTLAPRTSALVAAMLVDGDEPAVLAPFSPQRFGA